VKRNTNPLVHKQVAMYVNCDSCIVASYLTVLIPVGTAIIIVANVKYGCVTPSLPTVNIWYAHNTRPSKFVECLSVHR
jgi:hypothetical protein